MTALAQSVAIPARVHLQEITREDGEANSTRPLVMDLVLSSRPTEGDRLRVPLSVPGWWLKVSSVRWHVVESHYHISAKLVREDGLPAMMNEIESVLLQAGFQVNEPLLLLMQLMDAQETEDMDFDELLRYRDEKLKEQGYHESAPEVDRTGWAPVRLLVHEVEYGDDELVSGEIPPLMLDTSMPCVPQMGEHIGIGEVREQFVVGSITAAPLANDHLVRLHACIAIEDYKHDEAAFRAAGFVDVQADD